MLTLTAKLKSGIVLELLEHQRGLYLLMESGGSGTLPKTRFIILPSYFDAYFEEVYFNEDIHI